uniref:Uncharacterized protein n=1 Tax=Anguilla anguilla TaxID=7936 RepID=A0A0E9W895_ANGAN
MSGSENQSIRKMTHALMQILLIVLLDVNFIK